jgi:hypothetical protein
MASLEECLARRFSQTMDRRSVSYAAAVEMWATCIPRVAQTRGSPTTYRQAFCAILAVAACSAPIMESGRTI